MIEPGKLGTFLRDGLPTPTEADDHLLAEILVEHKVLTRIQAEDALNDRDMGKIVIPLGTILLDKGYATPDQLKHARQEQASRAAPDVGPIAEEKLGPYELLAKVGEGGVAVVYQAYDSNLKRTIALKILKAEKVNPRILERFHREAMAVARLSHPGIAAVFDAGSENDVHYVAMEFIEGGSLRDMVGKVELRDAVRLMEQAARAVHHAHSQGVVHRDIKPGNILIDSAGNARVVDFGLARIEAEDSELTVTGEVFGTPQYMAPEQAEGKPWKIGPLTDVYGLGITLYEIATGQTPYQETSVMKLYDVILRSEPTPPRKRNPDIPAELETVILKAIEKDPSRRYASALELAEDLRRWLEGEAVTARPASILKRAIRKILPRDNALRDEKVLYESLVENLPQSIFRKDRDGKVTFVNRRYCEWMGKSYDELIGKTDFDLFPSDLAEKYRKDDRQVMETGAVLEVEEEHQLPNGRKIFVQVVKTPLRNARGKLIGVQGIFWDISERRELQESIREHTKELERLSIKDSLTGAYNRRYLDTEFPVLLDTVKRAGGTMSLIQLAVDGGDEELCTFASIAKRMIRRKSDLLIRSGDNEFLVVLLLFADSASAGAAIHFAEELLRLAGSLKLCAGVAQIRKGESFASLRVRTGDALQAAKENGGNCAVSASQF